MTIAYLALNDDEIAAERNRLLASTRLTIDELRARATSYSLSPHDQGVLDQIDDLDFLADAS